MAVSYAVNPVEGNMENEKRIQLTDEDVIDIKNQNDGFRAGLHRISEIRVTLHQRLSSIFPGLTSKTGVLVKLLSPRAKGWHQGWVRVKINIQFEFVPDEKPPEGTA